MKQIYPSQPPYQLQHQLNCKCSLCAAVQEPLNPQLTLDQGLMRLKLNNTPDSGFAHFIKLLKDSGKQLPQVRWLDTVMLKDGSAQYAIVSDGRSKFVKAAQIKALIMTHKDRIDLEYQKKKYTRNRKGFNFSQFDHESEKLIKEFENNVEYISPMLRRVAMAKLKGVAEQKLLAKNEFIDLFDQKKTKAVSLEQIEYIQVFPVMYGEEEFSYVKQIKYFRKEASASKSFNLARMYLSTWTHKNQTILRLETETIEDLRTNQPQQLLVYLTCKLFLYFENEAGYRVEEALVEYMTNDRGHSYYMKSVKNLKLSEQKLPSETSHQLPKIKNYQENERISLKIEMNRVYEGFQEKHSRLEEEQKARALKLQQDRQESNSVYQKVIKNTQFDLRHVLNSMTALTTKKRLLDL